MSQSCLPSLVLCYSIKGKPIENKPAAWNETPPTRTIVVAAAHRNITMKTNGDEERTCLMQCGTHPDYGGKIALNCILLYYTVHTYTVADSRPARSAGRVQNKKGASNPSKFLCVFKGFIHTFITALKNVPALCFSRTTSRRWCSRRKKQKTKTNRGSEATSSVLCGLFE